VGSGVVRILGLLVLEVGLGLGRIYMGRPAGGNNSDGADGNGSVGEACVGMVVESLLIGRDVVWLLVGSAVSINDTSNVDDAVGSGVTLSLGLLVLEVGFGLGRT
jgi:hypothetical protein